MMTYQEAIALLVKFPFVTKLIQKNGEWLLITLGNPYKIKDQLKAAGLRWVDAQWQATVTDVPTLTVGQVLDGKGQAVELPLTDANKAKITARFLTVIGLNGFNGKRENDLSIKETREAQRTGWQTLLEIKFQLFGIDECHELAALRKGNEAFVEIIDNPFYCI